MPIPRETDQKKSLINPNRPGSTKKENLSPRLFPFDAFEFDDPSDDSAPDLRLLSPWGLLLERLGHADDQDLLELASGKVKINGKVGLGVSPSTAVHTYGGGETAHYRAQISDDSDTRFFGVYDRNSNHVGRFRVNDLDGTGAGSLEFESFDKVTFGQKVTFDQEVTFGQSIYSSFAGEFAFYASNDATRNLNFHLWDGAAYQSAYAILNTGTQFSHLWRDYTSTTQLELNNDGLGLLMDPSSYHALAVNSSIHAGSSGSRIDPAEPSGLIELTGSTSSALWGVQDGNGRIQLKWNASSGTSETYLVSSEDAFFWDLGVVTDPIWSMKYAGDGTAGNAISWDTLLSLYTDTFYSKNPIYSGVDPSTSSATGGLVSKANVVALYSNNDHYGYFNGVRVDGQRGFFLGWGNGAGEVDLHLDAATNLHISGGDVGIGVSNPGVELDVSGSIRASSNLLVNSRDLYDDTSDLHTSGGFHIEHWLRVSGSYGIYWQTYGGGWRMTDSTWIRAYNDKPVLSPGGVTTWHDNSAPANATGGMLAVYNSGNEVFCYSGAWYRADGTSTGW